MDTPQREKTFGAWAYFAIAKHYNKFIKYEEKVLKDKNPEHLHQMRVGMRRFRSALLIFTPAVSLSEVVTPNNIGKVARVLGKLRDIDVLHTVLIEQYQPHLPDREQKKLSIVLKKIQKKRQSAFKKVVKVLNGKLYIKLKHNCQLWLKNPIYLTASELNIERVLPDLLLPQISYFLLHPGWLIGLEINNGMANLSQEENNNFNYHLSLTQEKILHDLRKLAKKNRYNMELFKNIYCQTYDNYLQDIKDVQEILGTIQDCSVLENFLQQTLQENIRETMPNLSKILQATRQEQWQQWQEKQKSWWNLSRRQDLRTVVQYPNFK